jgi:hypothetical protein
MYIKSHGIVSAVIEREKKHSKRKNERQEHGCGLELQALMRLFSIESPLSTEHTYVCVCICTNIHIYMCINTLSPSTIFAHSLSDGSTAGSTPQQAIPHPPRYSFLIGSKRHNTLPFPTPPPGGGSAAHTTRTALDSRKQKKASTHTHARNEASDAEGEKKRSSGQTPKQKQR